MKKNCAFTLTEISVVAALIVLTAIFIIPNLIEDNKKLNIISQWKNTYQNMEYVFSALKAQATENDNKEFLRAKTNAEKEQILYNLLTPYLRIEKEITSKDYRLSYLDGKEVQKSDEYYISNFHYTNSGKIVGLKWLNTPVSIADKHPVAIMSIDLNGLEKPNKWGYDVFGVNIYTDRVEPIGKTDDDYLMKSDCSPKGRGIACSYYYFIYGGQLN